MSFETKRADAPQPKSKKRDTIKRQVADLEMRKKQLEKECADLVAMKKEIDTLPDKVKHARDEAAKAMADVLIEREKYNKMLDLRMEAEIATKKAQDTLESLKTAIQTREKELGAIPEAKVELQKVRKAIQSAEDLLGEVELDVTLAQTNLDATQKQIKKAQTDHDARVKELEDKYATRREDLEKSYNDAAEDYDAEMRIASERLQKANIEHAEVRSATKKLKDELESNALETQQGFEKRDIELNKRAKELDALEKELQTSLRDLEAREGELSRQKQFLEDKTKQLRQNKKDLEKHFNRTLPHIII